MPILQTRSGKSHLSHLPAIMCLVFKLALTYLPCHSNIMERHILRARVPTVFVFSDVYEGKHRPEDLERLIPSNVIYSSMVQIIPIQPVTKSKMKKSLESIVKAEGMDRLPSEAYEELHLSGGGDLRHAIFALQFRYGSLGIVNSSSKTKSESSNADNVAKRDVKLSSFHALGKLMYAKRSPRGQDPYSTTAQLMPGVKMWDDGRGPLNFVPEIVLESTDMPTNAALSFVAHHSPDFFTDITDLSQAFDRISDAGMFIDKFRGVSAKCVVQHFVIFAVCHVHVFVSKYLCINPFIRINTAISRRWPISNGLCVVYWGTGGSRRQQTPCPSSVSPIFCP